MYQAIKHRQCVIYWYTSNDVGFIQKYSYLAQSKVMAWSKQFWASWVENFNGNSGNQISIIYRLVMRIQVMMLLLIFHFLGHLWRENGRGYHACLLGSRASKPDQKVKAHQVDLLGQPLSRNHVFEIFRAGATHPPLSLTRGQGAIVQQNIELAQFQWL